MNKWINKMGKTIVSALMALCFVQTQTAWSTTSQADDLWQIAAEHVLFLSLDAEQADKQYPSRQMAHDIALDAILGLRFKQMPENLDTEHVALIGPHGVTATRVYIARQQRLVLVETTQELMPGSAYTIVVKKPPGQNQAPPNLQTYTAGFITEQIVPMALDQRLTWASETQPTPTRQVPPSEQADTLSLAELSQHFRFDVTSTEDDEIWLPAAENLGSQWRTGRPLPKTIAADINQALSVNGIKALGREQRAHQQGVAEALVTGQIFKLNDQPLAGVQISIEEQLTHTDHQGRFVLRDVPAGHHQLLVDGSQAGDEQTQFAEIMVGVEVYPDQKTPVKPMYLPKIREQDWIEIPAPLSADLIVHSDLMPGFEIHLPAGTILRDRHGKIVRRIATIPMPLDRVPVEYPVNTPLHMTLQPGGMQVENIDPDVTAGMQFVYPNYAGKPAGTRSGFLNYDPSGKGWYTYGYGEVSVDGLQIIPDPETVVYQVTGFGISFGAAPPATNTPNECAAPARDGDPVDLATGLFLHETQGPQLQDISPIDWRSKYRPNDDIERGFGKGTMHSYGAYLYFAGANGHDFWDELKLVLPDCSVLIFEATTPVTATATSTWRGAHYDSPTIFYGAELHRTNSGGYQVVVMTLRNGSVWEFSLHGGNLLSMTDRYGRTTEMTHSNGGNITRIASPSGRFVDAFYDYGGERITQLTDMTGRSWLYSYNGSGYLSQVTYPDNTIEQFTYDANNRMTQVHNRLGQRMVLNSYDTQGRITDQELADGAQYDFAYITDANGDITTAEVTQPNGTIRQVTFDADGYPLTDTDALGTALQRTLTYERNSKGFVQAITDPLLRRTELVYDSDMRLTALTVLAGTAQARTSTVSYNSDHDMISRVDGNGDSVSYTYDHLRRVTRVSDSHGRHIDLAYNANSQVNLITDHLGRDTHLDYQLLDLFSVTNTHAQTWYYLTDNVGRVIEQIDPLNQRNRYTYDINDDLIQIRDPRNQLTQFS